MVPLGRAGPPVSRIGLGMAALGRPAYITTGRADDFGEDRSEDAFRRRSWEVLDAAYAAGVRYFDCARSYGSAEAFVAGWLARADPPDVVVGSKWGYTYVGAWDPAAAVHEVKDHSLATFERQHAETVALLGSHLRLYQVHSATLDSGVLDNRPLHEALARQRDLGLLLGISTSGPAQAATIRRALEIRWGGESLFGAVQATWNLLEPSVEPALIAVAEAGWAVIVKEAVANGRLTARGDAGAPATPLGEAAAGAGVGPDALAIAAALARPWATVVLSGAATVDQLQSNLRAEVLTELDLLDLPGLAEAPADYWASRSSRPWQ
ncbi:MAG: aldo/keto reductase [Candidatus Dormibacteria bacterium]|jgi:aryl-alcohol dehydrogenase-like predicted oxidoreductase|nr:aldo/keto reductase [Chloroflexota bacterium]HBV95319.1 aldo/keto reductase [Chloroflexota bacterium]